MDPSLAPSTSALHQNIGKCRKDIATVYRNMDESGVSVDLVHRLELISASLEQIEDLLKLLEPVSEEEKAKTVRECLISAAQACIRSRSVQGHIKQHIHLLSRKIAERNGFSAEPYISRSSAGLRSLFLSAAGGGVIVVLMTIMKTLLVYTEPAPLFLAIGVWIIYSAGFLAMQFLGLTLATKLPSFTASHLAQRLKESRSQGAGRNLQIFKDELKAIFRSQWVAFVGNVVGLLLFVLVIGYLFQALFTRGLMGPVYAHYTLAGVNPVFSFAVFFGIITGIQLWLSSICGGWFENWIVFKRIPDTIANHPRFKKVLGVAPAKKLSDLVLKHASGVATNVSLGFLFGFLPFIGTMLGMELDSRHVTISTASVVLALFSLNFDVPISVWVFSVVGLLLIGLMNLGISFILALYIAARALNMRLGRIFTLVSPFARKSHSQT